MIERIVTVNLLPEKQMRTLGFTDRNPQNWHLNLPLGGGIGFDLTIPKDGKTASVYALDEEFGQPYPYDEILNHNPKFDFAASVKQQVESKVENLAMAGIFTLTG